MNVHRCIPSLSWDLYTFPYLNSLNHVTINWILSTEVNTFINKREVPFYNVIFFVPIYLPSKRKIFFTQHNRSKDFYHPVCISFLIIFIQSQSIIESLSKFLLNTSFRPSLVKNNWNFLTLNWWNMRCIFCQDDGLMLLVHVCDMSWEGIKIFFKFPRGFFLSPDKHFMNNCNYFYLPFVSSSKLQFLMEA